MNTNSKRLGAFIIATLFLTAVATTLRTAACLLNLDYASGFFTDKALINAANIIITVTAVGAFSYMFLASRINLRPSFSTSATYVPTGILGVATAFIGARVLSHTIMTCKYPILSVEVMTLKSPATVVGIIVAILAFLSIAHHFFNAFIVESKAEIRAYFAIATITFLAFYAILIYLDKTISISDASKILRLTAFLLCALFFLYEARISLGREMWRIYASFGLSASALTAYTSIPAIVTYYSNGNVISSAGNSSLASLEEYILLFALFIFITARLCIVATLREEKESQFIKALESYANEREERVNESFERYQELFASKQLSIFDLYGGGDIDTDTDGEEETESHETEVDAKKDITISDDAIYEAIFGKMPERPEAEAEETENAEPEDDRAPEEIAEQILSAVDQMLSDSAENDKKES